MSQCPSAVCVPTGFGGKAGSKSEHSPVFLPDLCWQLSLWWEVGLEIKGLESKLGVSWGFSYAQ